MQCSDCSKAVLPIVAVDIDGTLAQYHEPFGQFVSRYFNTAPQGPWDGEGDYEDHLGLDRRRFNEAKLAYRQGGNKRFAPLISGADVFMRKLAKLPVEVWITTTRPWNRLDNIDPDTQEWLARHEMPYTHLMYDEEKYTVLAKMVDPARVVLVVDDLLPMCQSAMTTFPGAHVIQPARMHNKNNYSPDFRTARNFQEIYTEAAVCVDGWYKRNDVWMADHD